MRSAALSGTNVTRCESRRATPRVGLCTRTQRRPGPAALAERAGATIHSAVDRSSGGGGTPATARGTARPPRTGSSGSSTAQSGQVQRRAQVLGHLLQRGVYFVSRAQDAPQLVQRPRLALAPAGLLRPAALGGRRAAR